VSPKISNKGRIRIGTLMTCEKQCGWPECESWNTITLGVKTHEDGNVLEGSFEYWLCWFHLEEFVKKYMFNQESNRIMHPDGTVDDERHS
jgi:hypothetical protein